MHLDGYDLKNCPVYDGVLYTQATLTSQRTTVQTLRSHPLQAHLRQQFDQMYTRYTWEEVNNFESVHREVQHYKEMVTVFFPMSFLMRLNADFRHRVKTQLHHFYSRLHFTPKSECVVIHIRRDDRTKQGKLTP